MMVTLDGILSRGFDGGNMDTGACPACAQCDDGEEPSNPASAKTSDDQKAKFQAQAQKAPTPFLYKALELMNQCDIHYRAAATSDYW